MAKPRKPASSEAELYTVSVESIPRHNNSSRCCQRGRLAKDLLCVTLIALGVICLAVAIFLLVFFLAADPVSGAVKAENGTEFARTTLAQQQGEAETSGNSLDNVDFNDDKTTVDVVDIHHHPHDDPDHDHDHTNHATYVAVDSEEPNQDKADSEAAEEIMPESEPQPKLEPAPETETEPTPDPEPEPEAKHEHEPETGSTILSQGQLATGMTIPTEFPRTEKTSPTSRDTLASTTTNSSPQNSTTTPKPVQVTVIETALPSVKPIHTTDNATWSVVTSTTTETARADQTTEFISPELKSGLNTTNSSLTVNVTGPSVVPTPQFLDNSPWKPILLVEEQVTSSSRNETTDNKLLVTPPARNETNKTSTNLEPIPDEVVSITLDDAVSNQPSQNSSDGTDAAAGIDVPELPAGKTTESLLNSSVTNVTWDASVSTQRPAILPPAVTERSCIRRSLPYCKGILPYPETSLPNWVGDNSEVERDMTFPFMEIIANTSCSQRVEQYACAIMEPPCSKGVALPPCRKFCQAVAESCKQYVLEALNLAKGFDCSQFPDSTDPNVCLNLAASSDEGECLDGEFHCADNTCIPENWVCDGKKDCTSGDDELTCIACREGEFRCETGNRCVPSSWRCDGSPDCKDGSDESNCNAGGECPEGQFRCEDGLSCIPKRWVCDGSNHCRDNSDEKNCTVVACQNDDFKCRDSGLCIPKVWVCDSNWDCKDGSDEESCLPSNPRGQNDEQPDIPAFPPVANTTAADPDICPLGQIFCIAGKKCIRIEQLCDGKEDCADGADERDCKQN